MSKPIDASKILGILQTYGVPVEGYKSWQTHNRGNRGNGWADLKGIIVHHTASDAADQREYLRNGSADLPGPLCQIHIDPTGKAWLIGWGRANHAGGGDPAVLQHVIKENYTGVLKPTFHDGEKGATDGNGYFYGIEIGYSGSHGMTPNQYRTLLRICAAICKAHGWTAKSVIGHGEWSDWKWDPGYAKDRMMDMSRVRSDIQDVISGADKDADGEPDAKAPSVPAPSPAKPNTYTVKKGDTIVFPGGGKVVVQ